ncbi:aminotransferase class V-fold PLP-dependent enzyme [Sinorhizobium sp. BG8]|uniref:pyridoxal phosphate-dependent decarboxylase family protein n=1 Tax=Sinorhizobium sp. BG8 TaxID=2613773 RepID=UPI00193D7ACE|nr:aminotransferase class V-fold PLP-dependent enzyme [Sinorhizobium sp. BG8]QRM56930.1 aspartate aminotransferase family protein [Sinorhizobium sp. BG8]
MDTEALFRVAAAEAARYRNSVPDRPHRPVRGYAESLAAFSEPLPVEACEPEAVIADLVSRAEAGLHLMVGPRFFGWVIGGSHPAGVAADMLTSAWGQNAGNHVAAPSASAVETVAARWLLELLDLPRESSVGFVTGATIANFTCLAAARGAVLRRVGWDPDANGLFGAPPVSVLIGDDAHTTVFSALQYLGLGHDRVVRLPTDREGRIRPDAFAALMAAIEGPCIVILQAGQINSGAFDDFSTLVPIARERGAWIHVDGAFGLWAQVTPALRHLSRGVDLADSWATDGHKWLQTPYDCGYAIVRDEAAHRRAMTIAASYLPTASMGERDPSHYVPELSRRARGFATWAMIKHLGREGIARMVERNCRAAAALAEALGQHPDIAVINSVDLNQMIIRFGASLEPERGDRLTRAVIAAIQEEGEIFTGGAEWRGLQVMRLSISNYQTDEVEAERAATAIKQALDRVKALGGE